MTFSVALRRARRYRPVETLLRATDRRDPPALGSAPGLQRRRSRAKNLLERLW